METSKSLIESLLHEDLIARIMQKQVEGNEGDLVTPRSSFS